MFYLTFRSKDEYMRAFWAGKSENVATFNGSEQLVP